MKLLPQRILTIIPLVALLLAWELSVSDSTRLRFLFGSPSLVGSAAVTEFKRGSIFWDTLITATEGSAGLLLGTLSGSIVGLILWVHRRLAIIAQPYIVVVAAIPIFAISPMLVIWFGTGLLPKIAMAGFSVFLMVLVQVFQGAKRIDANHRDWLDGIQASRWLALREVIFPESIRVVFEAMKASVGLALVGAFIGEFVVADAGLGYFILRNGGVYDIPRVILGLVLFGFLALTLSAIIGLTEKTLTKTGL